MTRNVIRSSYHFQRGRQMKGVNLGPFTIIMEGGQMTKNKGRCKGDILKKPFLRE